MPSLSSSSSQSSLQRPSNIAINPSNALGTLLPHLVASKRSLSTIEHVYRANDICTSTRNALEKCAITTARSAFLRNSLTSQLHVLQNVQYQTSRTAHVAKAEYDEVVRGLDEAERRLRETLRGLKETMVEAQLRPEGEQRRCLLDFVDESGVEGLIEDIRSDSKESGTNLERFETGGKCFQNDLQRISGMLDQQRSVENSHSLDTQDGEGSRLPEILADLEERAKDMAMNLESLVSHFDLCVRAIKHTEGGGDAAVKIAGDLPKGVDVAQDVGETLPESLNDEQRADMMRVLEEDAGQVEEVVMEIKGSIVEMEGMHQRVEAYVEQLSSEHESLIGAFDLLEDIGKALPRQITRNQAFLIKWNGERSRVSDRLEEVENAKGFYDGFLRAYDNLIIEIGRRKSVEGKIDRVIQDTMSKLKRLYEDDMDEREAFKQEQGEFLPIDIWPGLLNAPTRFNIRPVDGIIDTVPDISKSIIHKAIRRVHGQA